MVYGEGQPMHRTSKTTPWTISTVLNVLMGASGLISWFYLRNLSDGVAFNSARRNCQAWFLGQ